jgi:transposase, IS5 family
MQPRSRRDASQLDLFKAQFSQILNPDHPPLIPAEKIDWKRFDVALADCFCPDFGAPALPTRLMVGLLYLKHAFNESDESLLERWIENPYWQAFCGFTTMQHEPPIHPTSLVKWRQRAGAERLAELIKETLALAVREKEVTPGELQHVNVDTTVQEKNITPPTDSKLLHRAIMKVVAAARERGITLRQSYRRKAQAAAMMAGRYAHARQFKRMRKELRKLKTWLGRVLRDVGRKVSDPDDALHALLTLCHRLHLQQPTDTGKLYSLHEPEVVCISKGKAHKRYEFGQKMALATSNRGNWIVGVQVCEGGPYDGHTLTSTLETVEATTGLPVQAAFVDKGYRGHGYEGSATIHISGSSSRHLTRTMKQRRKRRSAIEPKIGHLKQDHRLGRCFLRGLHGDAINAVLAAAGSNLRKLQARLCFAVVLSLWCRLSISFSPLKPQEIRLQPT